MIRRWISLFPLAGLPISTKPSHYFKIYSSLLGQSISIMNISWSISEFMDSQNAWLLQTFSLLGRSRGWGRVWTGMWEIGGSDYWLDWIPFWHILLYLQEGLLLFASTPHDCVSLTMDDTLLAKEMIYASAASHFQSFSSLSESGMLKFFPN